MSNEPKTWECHKCWMKFHRERPYRSGGDETTCAEPGCAVKFGHGCTDSGPVKTWLVEEQN